MQISSESIKNYKNYRVHRKLHFEKNPFKVFGTFCL